MRQFGNYKKRLYLCIMKEQNDGYFCGIGWSDDAEWSEAILWEGSERTICKRFYIFNKWTPIYFKYVRNFGNNSGSLRSV